MKKNNASTDGTLWLYGIHAVKEALKNPKRVIKELWTTPEGLKSLQSEKFSFLLKPRIAQRQEIDRLLPTGAIHQGVALKTKPLIQPTLEEVIEKESQKEKSCLLILDQVTDPHNIGAILRSAAAFDCDAVLTPAAGAPTESGALAKSACGALETVAFLHVTNLQRAMEKLQKAGFWCVGLDGKAEQTVSQITLPDKTAFILGSEGDGLRRLTLDSCDFLVKFPISAKMESLNVSNAAVLALYEFNRRRDAKLS